MLVSQFIIFRIRLYCNLVQGKVENKDKIKMGLLIETQRKIEINKIYKVMNDDDQTAVMTELCRLAN